jgi:ADP-ribose pyrophosphatase
MTEILNVQKLTDYKWLNLFDIEFKKKDGTIGHWTFCSRKANPVLGTLPTNADAVIIIPLLKNGKKRKLVTIKEFRVPLGDYEVGFPAGLYDHAETAENVARRELKEETGLDLKKILYISQPCVSSAGLSDESVVYVVCECTGEVSTELNEATEEITVEILDIDRVREFCTSTQKISAKALPFFMIFNALNKIKWPKYMRTKD